MPNPHSTAQIAGHPIHPMLVPFPIAFFVATLVCDLVYLRTGASGWAQATLWLLGSGLVMAALAAVAGLIEVAGDRRIRDIEDVWWHAGGNVVIVLLQFFNWALRYGWGEAAISPWGLILSLVGVGLLLFTGWKGWELVYRHRVGIAEETETRAPSGTEVRRGTTGTPHRAS